MQGQGPRISSRFGARDCWVMADVVLHDALVEPAMLEYAPHARKIAVGKRCGQLSTAQQFINKQIVDAAQEHAVVVRLKGGDPMLFGRADEEMRALEAAGIEYEVVPGITAALASAAALKRSLTLRGVSRSVALATHSRAADTEAIREQVNADSLVFYMGRDSGPEIAQELLMLGVMGLRLWRLLRLAARLVKGCSHLRFLSLLLGCAQQWLDASQPSLLMIGNAFAARGGQEEVSGLDAVLSAA